MTSIEAQNLQFDYDSHGDLITQANVVSGPPQIVAQPQNRIVVPDGNASFSVLVANTQNLSYQWQFNGTNIAGATNGVLLISHATVTNEGQYTVALVNDSGSVTSSPAGLYLDSNGNGLPDSWEMNYFNNLNQTAAGDFDGDGVSNLQEFLDGTNPNNPASTLYRLTVVNESGSVAITPNLPVYTNGQIVTLTASPSNSFRAWTGDLVSISNSVTLTMNANKTLYARFGSLNLVWTNSSGDWNNAANWSPNIVPGSNDNVLINISATVTLDTNADCASLIFGNSSAPPLLTGTGALTLHGPSSWINGTMAGAGQTIIAPDAELTIANLGLITLSGRTLKNSGTTRWIGVTIGLANGAVITNDDGALFDIQTTAAMSQLTGGCEFDNVGTFRKSLIAGTNAIGLGVTFNNYGSVDLQLGGLTFGSPVDNEGIITVSDGTLQFSGTLQNNGTVILASGTTNRLTGGGAATGVFNVAVGALLEISAGSITLNTGAQLNGPGQYRVSGSGTLVNNTDVSVQNLDFSGTLNGTATISIGNVLNWTGGGMMFGSGRTLINAGATLNVNSAGDVTLSRTLENAGTTLCTGTGGFYGGGGSAFITNQPGALFEVQNDGGFHHGLYGCNFANGGTFRKTASTGTNSFSAAFPFNNYGTVDLRSGALAPSGGYFSASTAALNCAIGGTIPGVDFGHLQIPGAVTLNGALSIVFTNGYTPAVNDSFAVVSAGSVNGAFTSFSYPSSQVTMQESNSPTAVTVKVTGVIALPQPVLLPPVISSSNILLSWTAMANTVYRVEYKPDLNATNWSALPGDVIALSNTASKLDALTSSNRFYQVRVVP